MRHDNITSRRREIPSTPTHLHKHHCVCVHSSTFTAVRVCVAVCVAVCVSLALLPADLNVCLPLHLSASITVGKCWGETIFPPQTEDKHSTVIVPSAL